MKIWSLFLLMVLSSSVFAQQRGWGTVVDFEGKELKLGGRLQAIASNDSDTESHDFFLRRTRFNAVFKPWEGHKVVYDIRNDRANQDDRGEGEFSIGDAFWQIDLDSSWANNIRLFRAKVDVSYTQTSSSKNLFEPNRALIAEQAAGFVVQNRRAANAQVNGNFGSLYYQAAVSDGVQSDDLSSLEGSVEVESVNHQKFTYGGKLRYYFLGSAEKNIVQDTFYGLYDAISLGVGYFANDNINVTLSENARELDFRRSLKNAEFALSLGSFRFLSEYFEFEGDLIDLSQSSKDDILGDSKGHYAQAEYIFKKWAPYVGHESFDKWSQRSGYIQRVSSFGLNYYDLLESRRFGAVYKKVELDDELAGSDSEQIYAYFMLNF